MKALTLATLDVVDLLALVLPRGWENATLDVEVTDAVVRATDVRTSLSKGAAGGAHPTDPSGAFEPLNFALERFVGALEAQGLEASDLRLEVSDGAEPRLRAFDAGGGVIADLVLDPSLSAMRAFTPRLLDAIGAELPRLRAMHESFAATLPRPHRWDFDQADATLSFTGETRGVLGFGKKPQVTTMPGQILATWSPNDATLLFAHENPSVEPQVQRAIAAFAERSPAELGPGLFARAPLPCPRELAWLICLFIARRIDAKGLYSPELQTHIAAM